MYIDITFLKSSEDEQYKKYLKILKACADANVDLPREIIKYFGVEGLCVADAIDEVEKPLKVDAEEIKKAWSNSCYEGWEIEVKQIPKEIKTIRFYGGGY